MGYYEKWTLFVMLMFGVVSFMLIQGGLEFWDMWASIRIDSTSNKQLKQINVFAKRSKTKFF